ncbi:MAG: phosphoheptose isomerase [Parcubacteria group bacterium Gr01-1014_20]|nr:MAG: phosphoheptose isomerase [Parcubacteria group bacterium Gr01-1014_20]
MVYTSLVFYRERIDEERTFGGIVDKVFLRHKEVLEMIVSEILRDIKRDIKHGATLLVDAIKNNHRLLTCGNGGSAADNQHFVAEWIYRYNKERNSLPAIVLSVNTSVLTVVGSDYGFEDVFRRRAKILSGRSLILKTTLSSSLTCRCLNQNREEWKKSFA